jgi:hypothetical protein
VTVTPGSHQDRVARTAERARLALAIGFAELAKDELPCDCFYADGSPRFVTPDRKPVHRCGR